MAAVFVMLQDDIDDGENDGILNARIPRIFRDRLNPIDEYTDVDIIKGYRFSRKLILQLHDEIGYELESGWFNAKSP